MGLKCVARGSLEIQYAKNRHFGTIAQLCRAISSELRHVSTIGKKLLNSNTSSTCPDNMVNFRLLTAEICWRVWGTLANFNGFRVLAALLHGTVVVGISETLRHWTEGATYIRQGGHHIGHWPTFLVVFILCYLYCLVKIVMIFSGVLLWPPYVIGGPLYFCPVISIFYLSSMFFFFLA